MVELSQLVPSPIMRHCEIVADSELRVDARRLDSNVRFLTVPNGWTVTIQGAGQRRTHRLLADEVGQQVRWVLRTPGTKNIHLDTKMRRVEVVEPPSNVRMTLRSSQHNLYLSPAQYRIDADGTDVTFGLWVNADDGETVSVSGSARPRRVSGSGNLHAKYPLEVSGAELSGDLRVDGRLRCETVDVTGDLTCHQLQTGAVTAQRVRVQPTSDTDGPAVDELRSLTATSLHVTGEISGTADAPVRLAIRDHIDVGDLRHARLVSYSADGPPNGHPPVAINAKAVESVAVRRPVGEATLARVDGDVEMTDVRSLHVEGPITGEVAIEAHDEIEASAVSARGHLTAETVAVAGDVEGADGPLRIHASGALRVGGSARRAVLVCHGEADADFSIDLGTARLRRWRVVEPEVTEDEVTLGGVDAAWARGQDTSVTLCAIVTTGTVRIGGDVTSTLIRGSRSVQIAGRFAVPDTTTGWEGLDADLRERLAPPPIPPRPDIARALRHVHETDDLPAEDHDVVLSAADVVVGEDIELDAHHQIRVTSSLTCPRLTGGQVDAPDDATIALGGTTGSEIRAGRIGVSQELSRTTLVAGRMLHLASDVPSGCVVSAAGTATLRGTVTDGLAWAAPPGGRVSAHGRIAGTFEIHPTGRDHQDGAANGDEKPTVRFAGDGHIERLDVTRGRVAATTEGLNAPVSRRDQPQVPQIIDHTELAANTRLDLDGGQLDIGQLTTSEGSRIHQDGPRSHLTVRIHPASSGQISISTEGTVTFEPSGGEQPAPDDNLSVWLVRGSFEIKARLDRVLCGEENGDPPALLVTDGGSLEAASGRFALAGAHSDGRIVGARGRTYVGRMVAYAHAQVSPKKAPPADEPQPKPAQIVAVVPGGDQDNESDRLAGGHLVDVDVAHLPPADLRVLSHLHVFDPDGRPVMAHAAEMKSQADRQERSQRLKMLADVVAGTAASGTSRSAIMWSSARAHHAAARTKTEWLLRWLHRFVGYGQRPLPAILTFAAFVLATAYGLHLLDSTPECALDGIAREPEPRFIPAPYDYTDQVRRVLLLPAGLLRLEFGGAATYAPIACSATVHVPLFALTGLLLVYMVLAIRNYLRTPTERSII